MTQLKAFKTFTSKNFLSSKTGCGKGKSKYFSLTLTQYVTEYGNRNLLAEKKCYAARASFVSRNFLLRRHKSFAFWSLCCVLFALQSCFLESENSSFEIFLGVCLSCDLSQVFTIKLSALQHIKTKLWSQPWATFKLQTLFKLWCIRSQ